MNQTRQDGRQYDHHTLEKIRVDALRKVKDGQSPETVVRSLGMSRSCIYKWLVKYREGGMDALKARTISGRPKKINEAVSQWLVEILSTTFPSDHSIPQALWDNPSIRQLLEQERGISLSPASIRRLLSDLKLSNHNTQIPAGNAVNAFLAEKKNYASIRKDARKEGAEIMLGRWHVIQVDYHPWSLSRISAVNARGRETFFFTEKEMTWRHLRLFVEKLMDRRVKCLYLILINSPEPWRPHLKDLERQFRSRLKLLFSSMPINIQGK